MAEEPTSSAANREKQRANIARHHLLSIAVPFPEGLDWSPDETEESLQRLYDFACDLATSQIDWYLQRRWWKKFQSVGLRYASYAFAITGVAVPLIKIFNITSLEHIFGRFADDVSNIAVEAALALLAIAGGLHAIDRLIGASSAWMRYVMAAIGLTDQLVSFRLKWNALAAEQQFTNSSPPSAGGGASSGEARLDAGRTPEGRKFDLIREFCLNVIKVVRDETAIWSNEIKENVDKFEKDLSTAPFRAPGR
jgi:hypothetical protein